MTKKMYDSRTLMEKTSRVCVLGKKKLKSEGKIQRQEGMVIKDADKHLGKAKKCINLLKANNNENNNT